MTKQQLFSPGTIGQCELRNRIIMPLFPTKYATDSRVNPKMLEFYRARSRGGAGLIVLDCPCLDYPQAYKGKNQLRFDAEEFHAGIKDLLAAIQAEGAKAFMHLDYSKEKKLDQEVPGAKKEGDKWVVATANYVSPTEVQRILDVMTEGAVKARDLGYDGVEIQASYGGFIAQLLSPLLNKRDAKYGGPLTQRSLFLLDLISNIKLSAGPDFPVMVKLVCDEWVPGGLSIDEAKQIALWVQRAGADAIVANGGNKTTRHLTIPTPDSPPTPLLGLAQELKQTVDIPIVAIGKIYRPEEAAGIIEEGNADYVAMARALIADPEFPNKSKSANFDQIRLCVHCMEDCLQKGAKGFGRCCTVNPFAGSEWTWQIKPAASKKKVLVIGGGPAGIQSAVIAAQRGHDTELWEGTNVLGGQAKLAHIAPYKEEMSDGLQFIVRSIENSDVRIKTNRFGSEENILDYNADVVIVATGLLPRTLPLPGIEKEMVISSRKLYMTQPNVGAHVVILGGGDIGCETADWLARPDRSISIIEMMPEVLNKMKKIPKQRLLERLAEKKVVIFTDTTPLFIADDHVLAKQGDENITLAADTVITATNADPNQALADALKNKVGQVEVVGDAIELGNIGSALRSATEVALKI
jgi:2,4-dienoyl-CoA reductase-like NADH-dependent reductase (Old Yellow Enzyme family)/thioredoxin reductase